MTERGARIDGFLVATGHAGHARLPLAGDASARRYLRLTDGEQSLILMDCPPGSGEALGAFLGIARHLTGIGLCAPRIIAADADAGLALIEDLGPDQVAQWAEAHPASAALPYGAAVEVLVRLQSRPAPPGLLPLTPQLGAEMIAPLAEWYAPQLDLLAIQAALQDALARHAPSPDRLALRDYHAENLIWRPERQGTNRIGLLDFQDAVLAPAEYDLVSLLRDARRDVAEPLRQQMMLRFAELTDRDPERVVAACACLGLQRNLRILGIFARLARRDGKTRYLALMPRVWRQIQADLDHPALAALKPLVAAVPSPEENA